MLLHKGGVAASSGLKRAAGSDGWRAHRSAAALPALPPRPLPVVCNTQSLLHDAIAPAVFKRCLGKHAVARSSSTASSGVAMLVTAAAAAGSNGRFAGSSTAELEEWLVSELP